MVCFSINPVVSGIFQVLSIFSFFYIISCILFLIGQYKDIMANFEKYQCNPFIILTADFYGKDPKKLQEKCNFKIYENAHKMQLPSYLDVVGSVSENVRSAGNILSNFDGILDSVQNVFRSGFLKILNQVENTTSAAQYLIIKMETLLQRLSASLIIIMYTLSASMQGIIAVRRDKTLLKAVDTILKFPGF